MLNNPNNINIEDIYDIIEKPAAVNYRFLFAAIFAFVVLIIVIFFIVRKYLKHEKNSPENLAIKNLKALKIEKYFQENRSSYLYAEISKIIKNYFSQKTGINFLSMSDEEFVKYLQDVISSGDSSILESQAPAGTKIDTSISGFIDKNNLDMLIKLISNFQKVKFARHGVEESQVSDDISKIIAVLLITNKDKNKITKD